jgi:hypothetical protein
VSGADRDGGGGGDGRSRIGREIVVLMLEEPAKIC